MQNHERHTQAAQGMWYTGMWSATDWCVTILGLAGVSANATMGVSRPGYPQVPPLDGRDMWPALVAIGDATASVTAARHEVYISAGIMRVGDYKLITQNPGGVFGHDACTHRVASPIFGTCKSGSRSMIVEPVVWWKTYAYRLACLHARRFSASHTS